VNHDGYACADDGFGCTRDVCSGGSCTHPVDTGCLIGSSCVAELALNTSNDCERCHHATDPRAWSPVPSGTACGDDGLTCTSDLCDGARSCDHDIVSGRCLISGSCYNDGVHNSSNGCQLCDASRSQTAWSPDTGATCDDGNYCTTHDTCSTSGTCMGGIETDLFGVEEIAGAYFGACARLVDGSVRCWGSNSQGTLGDGTTTSKNAPVEVTGLTASATDIGAGLYHVCAVQSGGSVRCWGRNDEGQIGDGTKGADRTSATLVSGLGSVDMVCGGYEYSCARRTTGYVVCWGSSLYGQLGNGTSGTGAESLTYDFVVGPSGTGYLTNIAEISCGGYHVCARNTSNQIFCWGRNSSGQLGNSSTALSSHPVAVWRSSGDPVQLVADEVSAGGLHSCARQSGGVKCWGVNTDGQCGNGTMTSPQTTPVTVMVSISVPLSDATELDSGYRHSCVRASGGMVRCWGDDAYGQLGDGNTTDYPFAVAVRTSSTPTFLSGTTGFGMGGWASYAILGTDDNMIGWGQGTNGQIGDGGMVNRAYPVYVDCSY
jgi:alpha-tubulin suppressor-like RCC1 family protein